MATRVQSLNEAVCILHNTNIRGKGIIIFNEVLIRVQHPVSYYALGYPKESNLTQNIRKEIEQVNWYYKTFNCTLYG